MALVHIEREFLEFSSLYLPIVLSSLVQLLPVNL